MKGWLYILFERDRLRPGHDASDIRIDAWLNRFASGSLIAPLLFDHGFFLPAVLSFFLTLAFFYAGIISHLLFCLSLRVTPPAARC